MAHYINNFYNWKMSQEALSCHTRKACLELAMYLLVREEDF